MNAPYEVLIYSKTDDSDIRPVIIVIAESEADAKCKAVIQAALSTADIDKYVIVARLFARPYVPVATPIYVPYERQPYTPFWPYYASNTTSDSTTPTPATVTTWCSNTFKDDAKGS